MKNLLAITVLGLALSARSIEAQIPGVADTNRTDNLPTGRGQLSLSSATITLNNNNLQIVFIPLDERILRLINKEAYEGTEGTISLQRRAIDSVMMATGTTNPGMALVSFQGLAPNTRFDPAQVTLSYHGQQVRPVAWIPMSPTFSNQQLNVRQQVQALFIYRRDIPVRESFTVSYLGANSDDWAGRLPRFDAERSRILGTIRVTTDTTGH